MARQGKSIRLRTSPPTPGFTRAGSPTRMGCGCLLRRSPWSCIRCSASRDEPTETRRVPAMWRFCLRSRRGSSPAYLVYAQFEVWTYLRFLLPASGCGHDWRGDASVRSARARSRDDAGRAPRRCRAGAGILQHRGGQEAGSVSLRGPSRARPRGGRAAGRNAAGKYRHRQRRTKRFHALLHRPHYRPLGSDGRGRDANCAGPTGAPTTIRCGSCSTTGKKRRFGEGCRRLRPCRSTTSRTSNPRQASVSARAPGVSAIWSPIQRSLELWNFGTLEPYSEARPSSRAVVATVSGPFSVHTA